MGVRLANQVVLITGASSGIGEALAREVGRQGAKVAVAARRTDRLEQLVKDIAAAGGEAMALACDVTRDGDLEQAAAAIRARFGRLDVAVANAGFGVSGRVDDLDLDDFRRQFETNVFGVLRTVYAVLDDLKQSKGTLVLVGSVSSYLSLPSTGAYAMSKFAVRALAEALDAELWADGVSVLLVNPGFVESEIRQVNNAGVLKTDAKDPVPEWLRMPREVAARKIARAIASRRAERNLTAHGAAAIWLARYTPWLTRRVGRRTATPKKGARERHR
jgi:short-subunit dehydrogenase